MKTVVVGGGAAGMMAAITAAERGDEVILIEKNEKLGKKLFITGKGRCNLTNACEEEDFFSNIMSNPKFMYSSFYGFTNQDTMRYFEGIGLKLKTERGNRVFPASDRSSDVIRALKDRLLKSGVKVMLNTRVRSVDINEDTVSGVIIDTEERIDADRVILATGGTTYPGCGADDDTFRLAADLGIKTVDARPSLVPLVTGEKWPGELMGLSLKNVSVSLMFGKKKVYEGFGEMLFTHFGVSGPLILSASSRIKEDMYGNDLKLHIDLKPALDEKTLDDRVLRDFSEEKNRMFKNSISGLLPSGLIPVVVRLCGIDPDKRVNEITREERLGLVRLIKDITLTITGNRGLAEAIIMKGGISVKEIDPSTMQSRRIKGLYFAGEMIDVDALTGGFNLQIAWSTGRLAGGE